ncbi:MAG: tyrosine-type recombinase/integrase [Bacteroidales bacterium]|nr:tyrosine-type recombinase/integrase [Bacteroidales bacterium]MBR5920034.1 tyrosine-type recombinase/integrase [Bacteroidales bacterium]
MIHRSYTIRFVLHRRKDTPRQHLQMRVTPRGGKPLSFATGISLTDAEWDPLLGRARGRTSQAAEANTLIAQWSQMVANIFSHYESLNIVPTAEQLRKAFAHASQLAENASSPYSPTTTPNLTVMAAFTQFIIERQRDNTWASGSVTAYQSYRRMLGDFKPDTPLHDIDVPWMEAFHQWMVSVRGQQGVTVDCNLSKMRIFLHWARKKNLYNGDADRDYRPRIKGAGANARSVVYLTREELKRLERHHFAEEHYNVARDVFLFGCYTGLRSSDILKLSRADIHGDSITFTTVKTSHTLTVPLNDKAKAILDKYAGCGPNRRQKIIGVTQPALPTPDKKTMNKHLHKLMAEVGIDAPTHHVYYIGADRHDEIVPKYELITTHTARHTFIVTAIGLGIPIPVIMEWTGHSSFKNMKPYIAIANATSRQAMSLFNNL